MREAVLIAITGVVLSACGGDGSGPDGGGNPTAIAIVSGDGQTGKVAVALAQPISVRATGSGGRPVSGVAVVFAVTLGGGSVSSASVLTGADGTAQTVWTLGRSVAEQQRVQARIGTGATSLNVNFTATPTAGDPASATVAGGNSQTRQPGAALADSLAASVSDAHGNAVTGVTVTWSVTAGGGSVSPTTSTTNASGIARALLTLGPNPGQNTVQAAVAGTQGVSFTAQAVAPPVITSVSPDPVVAGSLATITGTNFSATAQDNTVTFNGSPAQIQQASATQLTVIVPCEPSGTVNITVSRAGVSAQKSHPLSVPNPIALQVGQSSFLPTGAVCRELTGGGRYVIAVGNTATGSSTTSFRLRGATTPPGPPPANITIASAPRPTFRGNAAQMQELKRRAAHQRVLDKNIDLMRRLGPPPRVSASAPSGIAAQLSSQQIAKGDTLQLKIPDLLGNLCTTEATVRARVVHA
ncbi:MAG: Ig-like domain-containing protein, partial [Gammaproteobacteria bacterium]